MRIFSLIVLTSLGLLTLRESSSAAAEKKELEKLSQKQVQETTEGTFNRDSTPQVLSQSSPRVPASGDFNGLIDIGAGRRMYLECRGSGSPTVILESGYRNDADIWSAELEPGMSPVFSQVAKFTRVCAYDRPGTFLDVNHLGRSTPMPMPRTARDLVSDLHALLQTARVPGPYVFAAHSFGGIFARLYASAYPNEVVGMVLVSTHHADTMR